MDRLISEQEVLNTINAWFYELSEQNISTLQGMIKAIPSAKPCDDAISRQAVLDMLEDINAETEGVGFYYEHYVDYIKSLLSVNPQEPKTVKSCDTCKHDEAFGCPSFIHDRCENYSEWEQADKSKGKALEQEPINKTVQKAYEDGKKDGYVQAKVEQEKTGHWIEGKYRDDDIRYNDSSYKCDKCGRIVDFKENFCPNCGAKMD